MCGRGCGHTPLADCARELAAAVDTRVLAHVDPSRAPPGWTREAPHREWAWGDLVRGSFGTAERGIAVRFVVEHFALPWAKFQDSDAAPADAIGTCDAAPRGAMGAYVAWAQTRHAATIAAQAWPGGSQFGQMARSVARVPDPGMIAVFRRISDATGFDADAVCDDEGLYLVSHVLAAADATFDAWMVSGGAELVDAHASERAIEAASLYRFGPGPGGIVGRYWVDARLVVAIASWASAKFRAVCDAIVAPMLFAALCGDTDTV